MRLPKPVIRGRSWAHTAIYQLTAAGWNGNWAGAAFMPVLEEREAWPEIEQNVLDLGELLAGLGARYLVLIDDLYTDQHTGEPVAAPALDEESWNRLIDTSHAIARLAKQNFGLRTVFHPHADSHVEYEEQIEKLLDETDPTLIGLALDTGHHAYHGSDPVAFIRKHHERLEYLHFKSVDPAMQREVARSGDPIAVTTTQGYFCEPWQGAVNFPALRATCWPSCVMTALRSWNRTCTRLRSTGHCLLPNGHAHISGKLGSDRCRHPKGCRTESGD